MGKRGKKVSEELKAEAVRLVFDGDMSARAVAQQCDVGYQSLCSWVKEEKIRRQNHDEELKEELARLRVENRELKMEREILKKATAFFAKESR